jgi:hypothetical protein
MKIFGFRIEHLYELQAIVHKNGKYYDQRGTEIAVSKKEAWEKFEKELGIYYKEPFHITKRLVCRRVWRKK